MGGVIEEGAPRHRAVSLIVDSFRHVPGALPLLAARRGQRTELGPGEGAHVAPADRIPVLLMDHLADRGGGKAPRLTIPRDFSHRLLALGGFATRFLIHLA